MPILEDGQIFERYRILRWLGSGSSGESYEAEDRMLLRKVTLKLIHPWASLSDSARRQFFREMQGISALNHPYLATVLDYGEIEGRVYVARRYVSSGSLLGSNGRIWFRPPLATTDAFEYAHQLAQVLQYIHQHGYLHGSLTFANLLVLRGPNVEHEADYAPFLVADIGLSNFVRRFGTPQMTTLPVSAAPEQLGKRVTPASDQFALAVLLYFWLAGRPPYLGAPDEVEEMKLSATITPLSSLNPGITAEQARLIRQALAVYPEERHSSVLAFTESLLASLPATPAEAPLPLHASPVQIETPRTALISPQQDEMRPPEQQSAQDEEAEPAALSSRDSAASDEASTAAIASTSLSSASYASALERLRSIPSTGPEDSSPAETASSKAEQEVQPSPLSAIPETPPLVEEEAEVDAPPFSVLEPAELRMGRPTSPLTLEPVAEEPLSPDESGEAQAEEQDQPGAAMHETEADLPAQESDLGPQAAEAQLPAVNDPAPSEIPVTPTLTPDAPSSEIPSADSTAMLPRVIVSSPYASSPYEFVLINPETNIGRAGASDLRLEQDDLTSRHHALLRRDGARVLLFDKHSHNGVYINGQKIEITRGYELTDGDHIGIGNYELIFRSASASLAS
jgi:serine/threonine protein kinase